MEAAALTATQRVLVLAANFFRKQLKEAADEKVQDMNTSQAWDLVAKHVGSELQNIQASIEALRTADLDAALDHIEDASVVLDTDPEKFVEVMRMAYEAATLAKNKVSKVADKVKAYGVLILAGYQYFSNGGEKQQAGIDFVKGQWKKIGEDPLIMRQLQRIISTGRFGRISDSDVYHLREIYDLSLFCETFSNGGVSRFVEPKRGESKCVLFGKELEIEKKCRTKLNEILYKVQCRRCQKMFAPYESLSMKSFCNVEFAKDDEERHHYTEYGDDGDREYYYYYEEYEDNYNNLICCRDTDSPGCMGPLHTQ